MNLIDFKEKIKIENTFILDLRKSDFFKEGFIPNSVLIGTESNWGNFVLELIKLDTNILFIADINNEENIFIHLKKLGYNNVKGFLSGGFKTWQNANEDIDLIIEIDADELAMDLQFDENAIIVDVRNQTEFGDGHIKNTKNVVLESLTDPASMTFVDDHLNLYIHCSNGYRSYIAASLFKKEGFHNIRIINGGWSEIKKLSNKFKIVKVPSVLN